MTLPTSAYACASVLPRGPPCPPSAGWIGEPARHADLVGRAGRGRCTWRWADAHRAARDPRASPPATAASRPPWRRSAARLVERGHEVDRLLPQPRADADRVPGDAPGEPAGRARRRSAETLSHTALSVGHAVGHRRARTSPSCSTPPTRPSCRLLRRPGSRWPCTSTGWSGSGPSGVRAGARLLPAGPRRPASMGRCPDRRRPRHGRPPAARPTASSRGLHPLRGAPIVSPGTSAWPRLDARRPGLPPGRRQVRAGEPRRARSWPASRRRGCQLPLVVVGDAPYADDYRARGRGRGRRRSAGPVPRQRLGRRAPRHALRARA